MSRPECDGECIPCTLDGETLHCKTYPPTVPLLPAQVANLRSEVSALRLRAETAEKDAAEAYAKGQGDMREDIRISVAAAMHGYRNRDTATKALGNLFKEISALPIKEHP